MLVDKFLYNDTILKQIFKIKEKDYCGDIIRRIEYNWKKIKKIEEFSKLESCEQNPKWHGEGDAWKHTQLVCESAEKCVEFMWAENGYIHKEEYFDNALLLLTAALFHDIGKIRTTKLGKDGNWHSYNHEYEGEKITRKLLWDTGYEFREKVCALVKYHMIPLSIFDRKDYINEIAKIGSVCQWHLLITLKKCDLDGSIQQDKYKSAEYRKLVELRSISSEMLNLIPLIVKRKFAYQREMDYIDKKMLSLIVMIGLPGSGKDTYIKDHYNSDKYAVISRDDIRAELGFCKDDEKIVGSSKQEEEVTRLFNEKMLEAAKQGKTIVINNINLKKEYREGYVKLLSNYNLNVQYVYVEASSLSKNIERRKGQIDKKVFDSIIEKLEWPLPYEYDKFIVAKN